MGSKRKYDESFNSPSSWWNALKEDMIHHGGFVHDSLGFCPETRELKVMNKLPLSSEETSSVVLSSNCEDDEGGKNVADGSLVMRIPRSSMITPDLALRLITPWWPDVEASVQVLQDSRKLYSTACDILLAMALAFVGNAPPLPSSRDNRIARAYLATLPDSSSYWDGLPRRWSEEQLHDLLQGSPLQNRARQARKGTERDFSLLQESFVASQKNGGDISPFPITFDDFSSMLAAVSSRAFATENSDSTVAAAAAAVPQGQEVLIPIFDLCDHCRGGQPRQTKKNISYAFQGDYMVVRSVVNNSVAGTTKDPSSYNNDKLPLRMGEALRITYGAQGNAQLLFNYGFGIPDNMEPDGSSNDVLEFTVKDQTTLSESIIKLRTGPKSYTYGCLAQALDFYRPKRQNSHDGDNNRSEQDDVEAFLTSWKEDDDDDNGDEDIDLYGDAEYPEKQSLEPDTTEEAESDLAALSNFEQAIQEKLLQYKSDDAARAKCISKGTHGPEYYAALLLHSETRTLHFFLTAARKISNMLYPMLHHQPVKINRSGYAAPDLDLIQSQTDELCKAFMAIRHSNGYL